MISLRMALVVTWAAMVMSQAPVLDKGEIEYLDDFGVKTSFVVNGGSMIFPCRAGSAPCTGKENYKVVHVNGGTALGEAKCESGVAKVRVQISDQTKFGNYHCDYEGKRSIEFFHMKYRTCSHNDTESMQKCTGGGHCIVGEDSKVRGCALMDGSYCPSWSTGSRMCPGSATDYCDAAAKRETPWAKVKLCSGSVHALPTLWYQRKMYPYGEPIILDMKSDSFEFNIYVAGEDLKDSDVSIKLYGPNGAEIQKENKKMAHGGVSFTIDKKKLEGATKVSHLFIQIHKSGDFVAEFSNLVVSVVPGKASITNKDGKLECLYDATLPKQVFAVFEWRHGDTSSQGSTVEAKEDGKYTCLVFQELRHTNPYTRVILGQPVIATVDAPEPEPLPWKCMMNSLQSFAVIIQFGIVMRYMEQKRKLSGKLKSNRAECKPKEDAQLSNPLMASPEPVA